MALMSAKRYNNAKVHTINVKNDIWASMNDVKKGLGVKNMSDLVSKEIKGAYRKKN